MLTTVIGSYPKPSFLKLPDWFNAKGGTDTKIQQKIIIMPSKAWVMSRVNISKGSKRSH